MKKLNIFWSRRDFRIKDNPALTACLVQTSEQDSVFLPIFILEDYMLNAETGFQFGLPSRYFLSRAIPDFANNFEKFLLVKGKGAKTFIDLQKLLPNFEIEIFVNEDVYIDFYKQVEKIEKAGIKINVFPGQLTVNKNTVSGSGNMYSIFTPFKKAVWKEFLEAEVLPTIETKHVRYLGSEFLKIIPNQVELDSETIWTSFNQKRNIEIVDYKSGQKNFIDIDSLITFQPSLDKWYFNEADAHKQLNEFLKNKIVMYKDNRDSLELDAKNAQKNILSGETSKLSLALAWGLLSAREIKQAIQNAFNQDFIDIDWYKIKKDDLGAVHYISELIWREFYKYLLFHKPELMHTEFQEKFRNKIDWVDNSEAVERFTKWIKGETGYKVVDAAMMQLAKTGWMHNRSRMIVASILTKNLGVDWRWGQEYFRAMLIDLDESSNNGGWQWGASVGADPKPIRIFNPHLQAENYDASGDYQKAWLGEEKYFFDYPEIIPHKLARAEALKRYGLDKDDNLSPRDY